MWVNVKKICVSKINKKAAIIHIVKRLSSRSSDSLFCAVFPTDKIKRNIVSPVFPSQHTKKQCFIIGTEISTVRLCVFL